MTYGGLFIRVHLRCLFGLCVFLFWNVGARICPGLRMFRGAVYAGVGGWRWGWRRLPRGLRALGCEARKQFGKRVAVRAGRWHGDDDAGLEARHAGGDLDEGAPDGLEGRRASWRAPGSRVARRPQQPVGISVEEEAESVGFPTVAGCAVRGGVELVLLDRVLHAPARAIDRLV